MTSVFPVSTEEFTLIPLFLDNSQYVWYTVSGLVLVMGLVFILSLAYTSGRNKIKTIKNPNPNSFTLQRYLLVFKTSPIPGSGLSIRVPVRVSMQGHNGSTPYISLPRPLYPNNTLARGKEDVFLLNFERSVGDIQQIKLFLDNTELEDIKWHLDEVCVYDIQTQKKWQFPITCPMTISREKRDNRFTIDTDYCNYSRVSRLNYVTDRLLNLHSLLTIFARPQEIGLMKIGVKLCLLMTTVSLLYLSNLQVYILSHQITTTIPLPLLLGYSVIGHLAVWTVSCVFELILRNIRPRWTFTGKRLDIAEVNATMYPRCPCCEKLPSNYSLHIPECPEWGGQTPMATSSILHELSIASVQSFAPAPAPVQQVGYVTSEQNNVYPLKSLKTYGRKKRDEISELISDSKIHEDDKPLSISDDAQLLAYLVDPLNGSHYITNLLTEIHNLDDILSRYDVKRLPSVEDMASKSRTSKLNVLLEPPVRRCPSLDSLSTSQADMVKEIRVLKEITLDTEGKFSKLCEEISALDSILHLSPDICQVDDQRPSMVSDKENESETMDNRKQDNILDMTMDLKSLQQLVQPLKDGPLQDMLKDIQSADELLKEAYSISDRNIGNRETSPQTTTAKRQAAKRHGQGSKLTKTGKRSIARDEKKSKKLTEAKTETSREYNRQRGNTRTTNIISENDKDGLDDHVASHSSTMYYLTPYYEQRFEDVFGEFKDNEETSRSCTSPQNDPSDELTDTTITKVRGKGKKIKRKNTFSKKFNKTQSWGKDRDLFHDNEAGCTINPDESEVISAGYISPDQGMKTTDDDFSDEFKSDNTKMAPRGQLIKKKTFKKKSKPKKHAVGKRQRDQYEYKLQENICLPTIRKVVQTKMSAAGLASLASEEAYDKPPTSSGWGLLDNIISGKDEKDLSESESKDQGTGEESTITDVEDYICKPVFAEETEEVVLSADSRSADDDSSQISVDGVLEFNEDKIGHRNKTASESEKVKQITSQATFTVSPSSSRGSSTIYYLNEEYSESKDQGTGEESTTTDVEDYKCKPVVAKQTEEVVLSADSRSTDDESSQISVDGVLEFNEDKIGHRDKTASEYEKVKQTTSRATFTVSPSSSRDSSTIYYLNEEYSDFTESLSDHLNYICELQASRKTQQKKGRKQNKIVCKGCRNKQRKIGTGTVNQPKDEIMDSCNHFESGMIIKEKEVTGRKAVSKKFKPEDRDNQRGQRHTFLNESDAQEAERKCSPNAGQTIHARHNTTEIGRHAFNHDSQQSDEIFFDASTCIRDRASFTKQGSSSALSGCRCRNLTGFNFETSTSRTERELDRSTDSATCKTLKTLDDRYRIIDDYEDLNNDFFEELEKTSSRKQRGTLKQSAVKKTNIKRQSLGKNVLLVANDKVEGKNPKNKSNKAQVSMKSAKRKNTSALKRFPDGLNNKEKLYFQKINSPLKFAKEEYEDESKVQTTSKGLVVRKNSYIPIAGPSVSRSSNRGSFIASNYKDSDENYVDAFDCVGSLKKFKQLVPEADDEDERENQGLVQNDSQHSLRKHFLKTEYPNYDDSMFDGFEKLPERKAVRIPEWSKERKTTKKGSKGKKRVRNQEKGKAANAYMYIYRSPSPSALSEDDEEWCRNQTSENDNQCACRGIGERQEETETYRIGVSEENCQDFNSHARESPQKTSHKIDRPLNKEDDAMEMLSGSLDSNIHLQSPIESEPSTTEYFLVDPNRDFSESFFDEFENTCEDNVVNETLKRSVPNPKSERKKKIPHGLISKGFNSNYSMQKYLNMDTFFDSGQTVDNLGNVHEEDFGKKPRKTYKLGYQKNLKKGLKKQKGKKKKKVLCEKCFNHLKGKETIHNTTDDSEGIDIGILHNGFKSTDDNYSDQYTNIHRKNSTRFISEDKGVTTNSYKIVKGKRMNRRGLTSASQKPGWSSSFEESCQDEKIERRCPKHMTVCDTDMYGVSSEERNESTDSVINVNAFQTKKDGIAGEFICHQNTTKYRRTGNRAQKRPTIQRSKGGTHVLSETSTSMDESLDTFEELPVKRRSTRYMLAFDLESFDGEPKANILRKAKRKHRTPAKIHCLVTSRRKRNRANDGRSAADPFDEFGNDMCGLHSDIRTRKPTTKRRRSPRYMLASSYNSEDDICDEVLFGQNIHKANLGTKVKGKSKYRDKRLISSDSDELKSRDDLHHSFVCNSINANHLDRDAIGKGLDPSPVLARKGKQVVHPHHFDTTQNITMIKTIVLSPKMKHLQREILEFDERVQNLGASVKSLQKPSNENSGNIDFNRDAALNLLEKPAEYSTSKMIDDAKADIKTLVTIVRKEKTCKALQDVLNDIHEFDTTLKLSGADNSPTIKKLMHSSDMKFSLSKNDHSDPSTVSDGIQETTTERLNGRPTKKVPLKYAVKTRNSYKIGHKDNKSALEIIRQPDQTTEYIQAGTDGGLPLGEVKVTSREKVLDPFKLFAAGKKNLTLLNCLLKDLQSLDNIVSATDIANSPRLQNKINHGVKTDKKSESETDNIACEACYKTEKEESAEKLKRKGQMLYPESPYDKSVALKEDIDVWNNLLENLYKERVPFFQNLCKNSIWETKTDPDKQLPERFGSTGGVHITPTYLEDSTVTTPSNELRESLSYDELPTDNAQTLRMLKSVITNQKKGYFHELLEDVNAADNILHEFGAGNDPCIQNFLLSCRQVMNRQESNIYETLRNYSSNEWNNVKSPTIKRYKTKKETRKASGTSKKKPENKIRKSIKTDDLEISLRDKKDVAERTIKIVDTEANKDYISGGQVIPDPLPLPDKRDFLLKRILEELHSFHSLAASLCDIDYELLDRLIVFLQKEEKNKASTDVSAEIIDMLEKTQELAQKRNTYEGTSHLSSIELTGSHNLSRSASLVELIDRSESEGSHLQLGEDFVKGKLRESQHRAQKTHSMIKGRHSKVSRTEENSRLLESSMSMEDVTLHFDKSYESRADKCSLSETEDIPKPGAPYQSDSDTKAKDPLSDLLESHIHQKSSEYEDEISAKSQDTILIGPQRDGIERLKTDFIAETDKPYPKVCWCVLDMLAKVLAENAISCALNELDLDYQSIIGVFQKYLTIDVAVNLLKKWRIPAHTDLLNEALEDCCWHVEQQGFCRMRHPDIYLSQALLLQRVTQKPENIYTLTLWPKTDSGDSSCVKLDEIIGFERRLATALRKEIKTRVKSELRFYLKDIPDEITFSQPLSQPHRYLSSVFLFLLDRLSQRDKAVPVDVFREFFDTVCSQRQSSMSAIDCAYQTSRGCTSGLDVQNIVTEKLGEDDSKEAENDEKKIGANKKRNKKTKKHGSSNGVKFSDNLVEKRSFVSDRAEREDSAHGNMSMDTLGKGDGIESLTTDFQLLNSYLQYVLRDERNRQELEVSNYCLSNKSKLENFLVENLQRVADFQQSQGKEPAIPDRLLEGLQYEVCGYALLFFPWVVFPCLIVLMCLVILGSLLYTGIKGQDLTPDQCSEWVACLLMGIVTEMIIFQPVKILMWETFWTSVKACFKTEKKTNVSPV